MSTATDCLKDPTAQHMVWYDIEKEEANGTIQNGNTVRQWKEGYVADLTNQHYAPSGDEISSGIVDLDTDGRRWEGMERENNPYG